MSIHLDGFIHKHVIYIGDEVYEGGNDYSIATHSSIDKMFTCININETIKDI